MFSRIPSQKGGQENESEKLFSTVNKNFNLIPSPSLVKLTSPMSSSVCASCYPAFKDRSSTTEK